MTDEAKYLESLTGGMSYPRFESQLFDTQVLFLCMQLPNRLGKMLAPLHWQHYRKQYGRLDEFVSSHKEV